MDDGIVKEIEARHRQRAERIMRATGIETVDPIVLAFQTAADCLCEEADLITEARRRGWQSTSKELTIVAARLVGLSQDVAGLAGVDLNVLVQPEPTATVPADATIAYLRGDTDTLPTPAAPVADPAAAPAAETETKIDINPFSEPDAYRPSSAPPFLGAEKHMRRFSVLMAPAHRPDLTHWSWSQLTTLEDCGLRYRLQKIEKLPQVPQWALVGGQAFHAAAEEVDHALILDPNAYREADTLAGDLDDLWRKHFAAAIAAQAIESPNIPMGADGSGWRASNRGAEGYTWWLVNGARMLGDYVSLRSEEKAQGADGLVEFWYLNPPNSTPEPAIEWEYSRKVEGPMGIVEVQGVIDRVYKRPDGSLLIRDLKTGSTGGDLAQLGEYAHAVRQFIGGAPTIYGQIYDARRNRMGDMINLLDAYPSDEFAYRYHAAEAQRRVGVYSPRKSSFCGGCAVRYACPVGGR